MKKTLLTLTTLFILFSASCAKMGYVSKIRTDAPNSTKADIWITDRDGKTYTLGGANHYVGYEKIKESYTVEFRGNKVLKIINKK